MHQRRMLLLAATLAFSVTGGSAFAQHNATRVWLNPGVYSHHFKRDQDYREDNYGLGAEVIFAPRHAAVAGSYINSNRERSRYAGYYWRPWQWRPAGTSLSAGLVFAMIDGYPSQNGGGWFPAALPSMSLEYGLYGANVSFIPNSKNGSALALQVKMMVW